MDPQWVDTKTRNVPYRKMEALGLGGQRWITLEQHQSLESLTRITSTGLPLDCFEMTGLQTRLGFCTEHELYEAQVDRYIDIQPFHHPTMPNQPHRLT